MQKVKRYKEKVLPIKIDNAIVVYDRRRMPMQAVYDGLIHNNINALLVSEKDAIVAPTMIHWTMIPTNTTAHKNIQKRNKRKYEEAILNIYIENEYIRASNTRYFSISTNKANNTGMIYWDVDDIRLTTLFPPNLQDIGHKGDNILVIGHDFGQGADSTSASYLMNNRNVYINKPSEKFYGKLFKLMRTFSKRPIVFRPRKNEDHGGNQWRNIKRLWPTKDLTLSKIDRPIEEDLSKAYVAINITSRASVNALICGVPIISLTSYGSVGALAETNLAKIDNPRIYTEEERYNLLCKMSYLQWSTEEFSTGEPYKYLNLFGLGEERKVNESSTNDNL